MEQTCWNFRSSERAAVKRGDTGLVHEMFTNNRHHNYHGHHKKQCPRIIIFSHSTIRSESIRPISVTEAHSLFFPASIDNSFLPNTFCARHFLPEFTLLVT